MKVAIIYDYVPALGGGGERLLQDLVAHFQNNEVTLYFGFTVDSSFSRSYVAKFQETLGKQHVFTGPKIRFFKQIWFRILNFMLPALLHNLDLQKYDLVISYTAFIAHAIIPPEKGKHLLYMNTPARFLWNLSHSYSILKELSSPFLITDIMRFRSQLYDLDGIQRVPSILAISRATAQRIDSYYNRPATILYPASINDEVLKTDYTNDTLQRELGTYYTHVSRIESYKNLDLLLDLVQKENIPENIVIMGDGPYLPQLRKRLRHLKQERVVLNSINITLEKYGNVFLTGFIEETKKMQILANASASFALNDEDFGITKVESLAVGTPIIGLEAGATPELIQEGKNGVLFQNPTTEALVSAIQKHRGNSYNKKTLRDSAKMFTTSAFHTNLEKLLHA